MNEINPTRIPCLVWAALLFSAGSLLAQGTATPENPMVEDKAGDALAKQLAVDKAACVAAMPDYTLESTMVPMRDGVKLCTEIFLPKNRGETPLPVILQRSPYSRWDRNLPKHLARLAPGLAVGIVLQNERGRFGSEGAGTYAVDSFDNEINDSYDTIEWVAKQPWCNGKVGMMGVSGGGLAGANAIWSCAPHLVAVSLSITSDNAYDWAFSNGARRYMYGWLSNRNLPNARAPWPRPVTMPFDPAARKAFIAKRAAECKAAYINNSGWYDIFSESLLDSFAVLAPNNNAVVTIDSGGHGGIGGDLVYPNPRRPVTKSLTFKDYLMGAPAKQPLESALVYFLMGDPRDPSAPGNIWKVADRWPVPNTPTSLYLQKDGGLSAVPSTEKDAVLTYDYDPRNPAPSFGGNWEYGTKNGPHDQRPLKDRKDILRFVGEPLAEPVGVTGKIRVELHVSSDVPDTSFVATLVDIYPDGYEALVRQGAMLARYSEGLDKPAPIEKGKTYKLDMDLWSTALVFNKGHRIALFVTSSSTPAFEVHPNTYDPVDSIDKAVVAHQAICLSGEHASRLILPVIPPESYLPAAK